MQTRVHPKRPELLAPAGNPEKLEIAVHYGADAVYLAGQDFSLRNVSGNFTEPELAKAVSDAHKAGVKVYVACNIYSRNHEQKKIEAFLYRVGNLHPDAVIIADPGIIFLAKKIIPQIDIHLSTQANTTNQNALRFWKEIGIKRVNLARELSMEEICTIAGHDLLEIETFIHGALCVSYSGRCLLSSFLAGRDSNRGLCAHPCRWKYAVVEEQRPGEYHTVMEDGTGTYIFNSKDLCMLDHIPELMNAGIDSFKIEGRMKGIGYLAAVVKTYREAIDSYLKDPEQYTVKQRWLDELSRVYHRDYCSGFYFKTPGQSLQNYDSSTSGMVHRYIGKIISSGSGNTIVLDIKNKISTGDAIEILSPVGPPVKTTVLEIFDTNHQAIPHAQPNTRSTLIVHGSGSPKDIVRKLP